MSPLGNKAKLNPFLFTSRNLKAKIIFIKSSLNRFLLQEPTDTVN